MDQKFLRKGVVLTVFAATLAAALAAQQPLPLRSRVRAAQQQAASHGNLFPLAVGNSWTYAISDFAGPRTETFRVTRSEKINGRVYFLLESYAGRVALVRMTITGRLLEYERESGQEKLWYDFGAEPGQPWRSELLLECGGPAGIRSRGGNRIETPAGVFEEAVTVAYGPTACADTGFSAESFAPDVGLIQRSEITIAGERTYELVEARIGSQTIAPEGISFRLAVDRPLYFPNFMPVVGERDPIPTLRARIALANETDIPVELTFFSGQRFDLVIRNAGGEEFHRWSEGKAFTEAIEKVTLARDGLSFFVDVRLGNENDPWPAGIYTAEAWITAATQSGTPLPYRSEVTFEIGEPVF